jgi:hypothetical protein
MHELCLRHGEDHLAAVLIPLAVDGTIVVASMSILLGNRHGSRGSFLAWSMLLVGSLASLGANIAVAEPSLIGRFIAAWPSAALIGSYELLMSQIRQASAKGADGVQGEAAETQKLPDDTDNEFSASSEANLDGGGRGNLRRTAWQWALRIAFLTGNSRRDGS